MAAAGASISATTVAYASAAASVASAAVGALAAEQQASAQHAEAGYQAEVASNNALIAKQNAEEITAAGNANAEQAGLKNANTLGAIRVAEATSGTDVNSGSNVDVQKSQRELGELDAQTIRSNAAQAAYGQEVNAASDTGQVGLDTAEAGYASLAGDIGATGSLLGGVSSVGSKYASWVLGNGAPGGGSGSVFAGAGGSPNSAGDFGEVG